MTPAPPPWPVLLIVLPLLAALIAFLVPRSARICGLLTMAGTPFLLLPLTLLLSPGATLHYPLGGWPEQLGIGLAADGLTLWLLWLTALVNLVVGLYSRYYFNAAPADRSANNGSNWFYPLWLLLWAALNGVLLSADLFNIYVGLELLGLAAVGLVTLAGSAAARRAALRYLLFNIFGSLCFLLGVVLIYRQSGSLGLPLLVEPTAPDSLVRLGLGLISLGLIGKSALFPLHFWLPPAHAEAPGPVSALLSALVVKASLYLLVRIWLPLWQQSPGDFAILFQLFGGLGAAAIAWGSIQALRATGLKELIAYSTVAQMGYLFLVFPLLASPRPEAAVHGLLFILAAHALAKAALFLAAGSAQANLGRPLAVSDLKGLSQRLPLTSFTMALAAVSLMGLPPSGGFIGKWYLLVAAHSTGQWWWALVIVGGGMLGMIYLLRPLAWTFAQPDVIVQQHRTFGRSARLADSGYAAPGRLPESAVLLNDYDPLERQVAGPDQRFPSDGGPAGGAVCPVVISPAGVQPLCLAQWPVFLLALAGILLGILPWSIFSALSGGGWP